MTKDEQLSGRALNKACAKVIGTWEDDPKTAATQAEMLAWLKQFGGYVEITVWPDNDGVVCEALLAGTGGRYLDTLENGSTIDEALKRLVVAVAKERSK